ncbi:MAG: hypothetical protein QF662_01275 [Phycisphaerae bacterium]|nr:hypothetical protein [Phycisphaerae bacterium]
MSDGSPRGFHWGKTALVVLTLALSPAPVSCNRGPDDGADANVTTMGSVEVTAQLVEIRGKPKADPLYNYAWVMKYRLLEVHRGKVSGEFILVAHYNPYKPRPTVQDFVLADMDENVGGRVKKIRLNDIHRIALKVPASNYWMGGIVNKFYGEEMGPIYWAVWTNLVIK